jgi:heme-degrading monooxygenase HmoA
MGFELAQINIGRLLAPIDSPQIADFVANLDRINALAEAQAGFVWRLTGEGNNATDIHAFDDPRIALNISVWESLEALAAFVYRTDHREVMRRRRAWFEAPSQAYMALWWIPAGHQPTPAEGRERLEMLQRLGPTPGAFSFREPFPSPGAASVTPILDECA